MDTEGRPILMPVELLQQTSGGAIDVDECVAKLSRAEFEAIFSRWIEWSADSPDGCALRQLAAHDRIEGRNE